MPGHNQSKIMIKSIQSSWFSNGNLMISGEYFVLAGAKALAVPLKAGQLMKVECHNNKQNVIKWKTNETGKPWFEADFSCNNLDITWSSDIDTALRLQKLLIEIQNLKPYLFSKNKSYLFTCDIDFSLNWGWGSSSTLISNLANWAGIDPFGLNNSVSSGSGYDIAASLAPAPIFFRINEGSHEVNPVVFDPPFKNQILFIYLGNKQSTSASVENNIPLVKRNKNMISFISDLTEQIAKSENIDEFERCIIEHEKILSITLNMTRIKEKYFNDFEGEIKSLGAWGGDFGMVVSRHNEIRVKKYFKDKGLETVFRFDKIVKTNRQ